MKGLKVWKVARDAERENLIPVVRDFMTAEKSTQDDRALNRPVTLPPQRLSMS